MSILLIIMEESKMKAAVNCETARRNEWSGL